MKTTLEWFNPEDKLPEIDKDVIVCYTNFCGETITELMEYKGSFFKEKNNNIYQDHPADTIPVEDINCWCEFPGHPYGFME